MIGVNRTLDIRLISPKFRDGRFAGSDSLILYNNSRRLYIEHRKLVTRTGASEAPTHTGQAMNRENDTIHTSEHTPCTSEQLNYKLVTVSYIDYI